MSNDGQLELSHDTNVNSCGLIPLPRNTDLQLGTHDQRNVPGQYGMVLADP